jgi:hypothetical protein
MLVSAPCGQRERRVHYGDTTAQSQARPAPFPVTHNRALSRSAGSTTALRMLPSHCFTAFSPARMLFTRPMVAVTGCTLVHFELAFPRRALRVLSARVANLPTEHRRAFAFSSLALPCLSDTPRFTRLSTLLASCEFIAGFRQARSNIGEVQAKSPRQ